MRPAHALVFLWLASAAARGDSSVPVPATPKAAPAKTGPAARGPDRDGDGVPDAIDKCPDDPEDKDGYQDEDGCPDPDNDVDRIPDVVDKCPNEAEVYNNFEDEDGCPDEARVIVTRSRDYLLDKIYFPDGRAEIPPVSFPILDAVAAVLSENPSLTKVAVQGHTDAREAKSARGVGLQRAEAAAAYLRAKGILGSRLVAVDAGAAHPVATNATRAGRAKNRRVEWVILTRSEPEPHK